MRLSASVITWAGVDPGNRKNKIKHSPLVGPRSSRKRSNLTLLFSVYIVFGKFSVNASFVALDLVLSVLAKANIGWEEPLRNNLCCVASGT